MNAQSEPITVAGKAYRAGKLSALKQFHVVRRLGPMLVVAGVSVQMLNTGMKTDLDDMVRMAGPVMEFLAKMSDEDVDYVLMTCLQVAQRGTDAAGQTVWSNVIAPDGKTLMFDDLDMPAMVRVVLEVLKHNMANFLTGLGDELTSQSSSGAGQPVGQGSKPSA
jgi:hypothetical protein